MLPRWLAVNATDAQLLAHYPDFLQVTKDLAGHALGQVDEAVIIADVDVADVSAFELGAPHAGADAFDDQ